MALRTHVLEHFEDPRLAPHVWEALLAAGDSDVVFLTWHWQRAWWESFGRGRLLLVLAEREGHPVALAPLFADGGMIFFVGSGGSDYLDFIGNIGDPEVLVSMLTAARAGVPDFVGFRFYHVPEHSRTGGRLQAVQARLELDGFLEGTLPAPAIDLAQRSADELAALVNRQSLVRHERGLARDGQLEVEHLHDGAAILPHLEGLFSQHIARWSLTSSPSLFLDPAQQAFYRRLARDAAGCGWLRFTRLLWNGRPVAYHFGSAYRGRYLWYKPSFEIELARRSPGEVLLRQLLIAARDEGAGTFDFGLGDEPFKHRFATRVVRVHTWGLYPARGPARSADSGGRAP